MKVYYFEHDCRSFVYSVHTLDCEIIKIGGQKFAKAINSDWMPEIPETRFALSKKDIIEKVRSMINADLEYIEQEYSGRKEYLNGLLNNGFKITAL